METETPLFPVGTEVAINPRDGGAPVRVGRVVAHVQFGGWMYLLSDYFGHVPEGDLLVVPVTAAEQYAEDITASLARENKYWRDNDRADARGDDC